MLKSLVNIVSLNAICAFEIDKLDSGFGLESDNKEIVLAVSGN